MCKGADNIMYPLCDISPSEQTGVDKSLMELANMGLRTLIVAHKELSKAEAQAWMQGTSRCYSLRFARFVNFLGILCVRG